MKKFLIVLLILLLAFPMYAAAAPSPTTDAAVTTSVTKYSKPAFTHKGMTDEDALNRMFEELKDYTLEDAYVVNLEEPCEVTYWQLMYEHTETDDIRVVIAWDDNYVIQQPTIIEDMVSVDFTNLKPGIYFVYFFCKSSDA